MRSPDLYRHRAWRLTPMRCAKSTSLTLFLESQSVICMAYICHRIGDSATKFVTNLETGLVAYLVTALGHG